MIKDREDLLIALHEACELEHNLACLYLFAAFSIRGKGEGLTQDQETKVRSWKQDLLKIAREEMEHLGTVSNLLTSVGGSPHFGRPNFPQAAGYYAAMPEFTLERFSLPAIKRFVEFERRHDAPPAIAGIAPDPLVYRHVGELYAVLRDGFATLPEADLFIGPPGGQDDEFSGASVAPRKVTNRADALAAIDFIVERGEGTSVQGANSHYQIFFRIYGEYKALQDAAAGFDAARPVINNPVTRQPRDARQANVIFDPVTRDVAELFNSAYGTLLLMLRQYYSFAGEGDDARDVLREAMRSMMYAVIRPLGELLTRLPAGAGYEDKSAGPGFELYGDFTGLVTPKIGWMIVLERLAAECKEAERLAGQLAADRQDELSNVGQSLNGIRDDLQARLAAGV